MHDAPAPIPAQADTAAGVRTRVLETAAGRITYLDTGSDTGTGTGTDLPVALFVHGVATSSLIWRNALPLLAAHRRCIAVDLPMHGGTDVPVGDAFSLVAMADVLAGFCDALGLNDDGRRVDLVGNDTGGAVAQVLAAREPERLRSLTLTDCDTAGNLPPKAFLPVVLLARARLLVPAARALRRTPRLARAILLAGTYEKLSALPAEIVRGWMDALLRTPEGARRFQRWLGGMNDRELRQIEPELRTLTVPTVLIWGTCDRFFRLKWAHRLRAGLPGPPELVTVERGHLFLVDERAAEFAGAVARHWTGVGGRLAPQPSVRP